METNYFLNDVDNFISSYRNIRNIKHNNLSLSNNIKETNENIDKENIKNIINEDKNVSINKSKLKNLKNNYEIFYSKNQNKNEYLSIFGNIYNSFSNNLSINKKENVFDTNILDDYLKELDLNYEKLKEERNENILKKEIKEKKNIKNIIKKNKYKKYININHNYIIKYSDKNNLITLDNYFFLLLDNINYFLYNDYIPVSYENNNINIKKYQDLLKALIDKNYIKEPCGNIILLLIKNILLNNFNLDNSNFLEEPNIINKILKILFNSIRDKLSFSNIINSKKVLDSFNAQNLEFNNYNFLSDQNNNNPIDFIIKLFTNDIFHKKNNILYFYLILLNLNENNIIKNSKEIFENFEIILFILFKYFLNDKKKFKKICEILVNNTSQNMTFCQYILIKMILGNIEIKNEKYYAKILTRFLNFLSMEKLLIADYYNLILYTNYSKFKDILAKSSILIKYKYSLLKQNYKLDENDLKLKTKIYNNIAQFGKIHKNKFFFDYIKNEYSSNKNLIDIDKKDEMKNIIIDNKHQIDEDKKENSINDENYSIKNNENNNINNNGFFSTIKFAFGFG